MARKIREGPVAPILGALGLVLAAFWLYAPALHGTWLWDDREDLPENPILRAAHPLRLIWSGQSTLDYYPVKSTLQWLQWNLWGERTLGYHVTNVALHALSALLLWRILRRLGLRAGWAWFGGMLFLVHPVAVGSVAWITEFKDTLSLPLLLLAANCYLDLDLGGTRPPGELSGPDRGWASSAPLALSWLWFVLAMLAKSSVMMFPVCLLLYGWYARRPLRRTVLSALPFFAVSAILGWVAVKLQHDRSLGSDGVGLGGLAFRLSLAPKALAVYLRQAIAPHDLAPVYTRWIVGGFGSFAWWLLPLAILVAGLWKRESWGRPALLGLGWFGLILIPVLGVVGISYMRFSWVMDHLAYAALVGVAGLAAAALQQIADWRGAAGRSVAIAAAVAVAAVLAAESRAYVPAYEGEEAVWTYTVNHRPDHWMGQSNLGVIRLAQNRLPEATALLQRAVRAAPDAPDPHRNLAVAYSHAGRSAEAIAEARRALELRPGYLLAISDLGTYLAQAGRYSEALPYWEAAIALNPADADLRNRYGYTLLLLNRRAESLVQLRQALALDPRFGPAELNLALAFTLVGQHAEALPHYEAAARLMPDNPAIQQQLAVARKRLASP